MKKNKQPSLILRVNGALSFVIFVFLFVAGMTTILSVNLSSESVREVLDSSSDLNKLYLYFFGSENKYYIQNRTDIQDIPITKLGFQIATNIKINDVRTLLDRELPGFSDFNTKIEVAGQGTNLRNLPIESAPPMDVLLKNRQISENAIKNDTSSNQSTPPTQTTNGKKVVYIYHTHSWESYLPLLQGVTNPDDAVSSNNKVNVVGVGDMLVKDLEEKGIESEHSTINAATLLHQKGLDANSAYKLSRELVQEAFAGNHDLTYAIDIHRDSSRRAKTTITINGKSYARLDFILGESNPHFKQNLEFAKALHNALEKKYPGLSRGLFSKNKSMGNGLYNQDLSPRSILVEVGGVDNTYEELQNAMQAFADIFSTYYWQMKNAGEY